jgi:hypothetical protein
MVVISKELKFELIDRNEDILNNLAKTKNANPIF